MCFGSTDFLKGNKRNKKKIFSASSVDFFCSNVILSLYREGEV